MALIIQKLFYIIFAFQLLLAGNDLDIKSLIPQDLSYQAKLGQTLMFNIGPNTDETFLRKIIKDYKIGNFNLIGTYSQPTEVKRLTKIIQEESKKYLSLEPFIAVDEEGYIKRLNFLNSVPQGNFKNQNEAYREALIRGDHLRSLGFNMVFSPVLDFTENTKSYIWPRTFQKDLATTVLLGKAMIKGYGDVGIISIPKHFPGYINNTKDPHGNDMTITKFSDYNSSLNVFKQVVKDSSPYGLMMAHVSIEEFGDKPITRSREMVNFLYNELNYYGLFVTDSLGMQSFRLNDSFEETSLESLLSGYNLLILSSNKDVSLEIVDQLYKNLGSEEMQNAIDKSFFKIYFLKKSLGLDK